MKIKQVFKKRFVRIFSVLAAIGVIGSFGFNAAMTALNSSAATGTVNTGIGVSFYGYTVPPITAGGRVAYCLNMDYVYPNGQTANGVNATGVYNSPEAKGILYYGYGGPAQAELMNAHGVGADDARRATQIAIWVWGKDNNVPANHRINSNPALDSGPIKRYFDALMAKRYSGTTGGTISINNPVVSARDNGDHYLSDIVSVTGSNWNFLRASYPLAEIVEKTANTFRVKIPKTYTGSSTTITISGGASGSSFTPIVWSVAGYQDVISMGDVSNSNGGSEANVTVNIPTAPSVGESKFRIKKVDPSGTGKSGAVFEVSTDRTFTNIIATLTSGAGGHTPEAGFTIPAGSAVPTRVLYIREKTAPAGMIKSNEIKEFVLIQGDSSVKEVSFVNQYETVIDFVDANVRIYKKDADGRSVDGVVFDVSDSPNFPAERTQRVTTMMHPLTGGGSTLAGFSGYTRGQRVTFYIKEVSAPSHLVVDSSVKTVTVIAGGDAGSIEIVNQFKSREATASIIKTDDQNNRLANAVFEISTDRNFATDVSELTTPNGGVVSKTFQLTGDTLKVYVREKTAPNGYVKSTEVKEMTLRAGQAESVTYVNTQKTLSSTAKIVKKDAAGNFVQGVQFEIATNAQFTGAETLTTNAQGEISKSFTATGTQTLPTVYVREKTVPVHLVLDTRVQSKQLVDGQTATFEFTNQFKPVTLKLVKKDAAGNFVQGVVFEVSESQNFANLTTLTTGANGEISREFPTSTREKTFYVREKTVPAHLVLSTEVKNVRISAGQTGTVEYVNQFNQADLTIRKVDEKGKTVQGVVFEIADNAQFTNPQTVTTNAQGVATRRYPTTQAAKTYYIREKSVPSHLVLSKEVKTLTLAPNTNPTVTFTNEFVEREVKLSKRDVSSADPIEGVTFTIYDAEDKDNKTKIYETITNKEGDLPGLKLKPGKYKFIETHAPIGYKINPNPHFFEVLEDGTILGSTIMTDEREEYEFEIDKVDNKGNKVRGVVFEAKNKLTGEILTATTDQDGVAKFKGIWADYEITEKSAPEGYEKDNNVYILQLKIDGTYERMKVVNNKIEAPNTGAESANFLPILAGVASILLGGTAFFAKKRF